MKLPFLASFIVFLGWLAFVLSRNRRKEEKNHESFWEKESRANSTRRKPLDNLNYITIPFDALPMDVFAEDEKVSDYHETLRSLSDSPIVNFSGISNTDLKLAYGAPNIELLMRYDQNYTTLARTLQLWADRMYRSGYVEEARCILEFALSTGTDVSGTYRLLSTIYREEGHPEKIDGLLDKAEQLQSGSRKIIVRILQESGR